MVSHENRFNESFVHRPVSYYALPGEEDQKGTCVVCNANMRAAKAAKQPFKRPNAIRKGCSGCPGIYLCSKHFKEYHTKVGE